MDFKKYFFCWRCHLSNDDIISVFVNMYVAFCDGLPPGLETGVDFRGQVCIGVTCFGVTCFGLKKGQDLENRTADPLQ